MINALYPVSYCHICEQLMCYTRYENGDVYSYCNNSINSVCMGFVYSRRDNDIKIKEFSISGADVMCFRVFSEVQKDGTEITKNILLMRSGHTLHRIEDLVSVKLETILNKAESLKLLKTISKQVLLLD